MINIDSLLRRNRDIDPRSIQAESDHVISVLKTLVNIDFKSNFELFHNGLHFFSFKTEYKGTPCIVKIIKKSAIDLDVAIDSITAEALSLEKLKGKGYAVQSHLETVVIKGGSDKIIGVIYRFVDGLPVDRFIRDAIEKEPPATKKYSPISQNRLDNASTLLSHIFYELSKTINHIESEGIFHFDLRPENVLISKRQNQNGTIIYYPVLIDFGSAHGRGLHGNLPVSQRSSYCYAPTDLKLIIEKGNDQAFGNVSMFQLGKTIESCLTILKVGFGENFWSSYSYSYLETLKKLLLGNQLIIKQKLLPHYPEKSISDLEFSQSLLLEKTIKSAASLMDKFERQFDQSYFSRCVPELGNTGVKQINTGLKDQVSVTPRIEKIIEHPCFQRLKNEKQLASVSEVFPNATHSRFSHSIGVYGAAIQYFNSLVMDHELPKARILIDPIDIEHGLLVALLHDLGQSAWGHDFENSGINFISHETMLTDILKDNDFPGEDLEKIINNEWSRRISVKRMAKILNSNSLISPESVIDYLIKDIISGPIDADKFDYLCRDSIACGVPYGLSFDKKRFLDALCVRITDNQKNEIPVTGSASLVNKELSPIGLSYKAKGATAVESLLLARYQMYGAVYWHHTNRSIISMFTHAAKSCFGYNKARISKFTKIYYSWVILGRMPKGGKAASEEDKRFIKQLNTVPIEVKQDRALAFIWVFSEPKNQKLIEFIAHRKIYKRIFEARMHELDIDFEKMKSIISSKPMQTIHASTQVQTELMTLLRTKITEKYKEKATAAQHYAFEKLDLVSGQLEDLVIIDIPHKGVPNEKNLPYEFGDTIRKYVGQGNINHEKSWDVFMNIRDMQMRSAMVRVFVSNDLQELAIRYLSRNEIYVICNQAIDKYFPGVRSSSSVV